MSAFRLDRIVELLTSTELIIGLLWAGLAVFTITLIVLMLTRWGQSRALFKCLVLSLLAHLLLAGYATTVRIVANAAPEQEPGLAVGFVEVGDSPEPEPVAAEAQPWEQFSREMVAPPTTDAQPLPEEVAQPQEPERQPRAERPNLPGEPSLDSLAMADADRPEPAPMEVDDDTRVVTAGKGPERIEAPRARRREAPRVDVPGGVEPERQTPNIPGPPRQERRTEPGVPAPLLDDTAPLPRMRADSTTPDPADALAALRDQATPAPRLLGGGADSAYLPESTVTAGGPAAAADRPDPTDQAAVATGDGTQTGDQPTELARVERGTPPEQVPDLYRLRVAPDRAEKAQRHGGTPATESAVRAALKWLAANQAADGRWRAARFGAGSEQNVLGRNRYNAGSRADTGITGLTLLAMLGSGHTHRDGEHSESVRRGLEFLLRSQRADGNLDGPATTYAQMYCHAMATFALSEAYGMTADERLRKPVARAIQYTIDSQNPSSGGWRYVPGDPGDTSQLGWQLMALKSAQLSGIETPQDTRDGMIRFLRSVSGGQHGGLSRYRPGERISRPMTAEALASWQFLGMPRAHPASDEAGDYILQELPGQAEANFYYWYYATLATYQLGGRHWEKWNEAMQRTLLKLQRTSGPEAGSWDPDTVWGGYGGRVYTTALGALCLEVYYRFLPLYVEAAAEARRDRR